MYKRKTGPGKGVEREGGGGGRNFSSSRSGGLNIPKGLRYGQNSNIASHGNSGRLASDYFPL